eukprot:scaffold79322_cov21-Tisochrysis_lutea.AAC.3
MDCVLSLCPGRANRLLRCRPKPVRAIPCYLWGEVVLRIQPVWRGLVAAPWLSGLSPTSCAGAPFHSSEMPKRSLAHLDGLECTLTLEAHPPPIACLCIIWDKSSG